MKLSRAERAILINQYEILKALKIGTYESELSALRNNFELALDWLFGSVQDKSVSREDCQEVQSILAMYSFLRACYDKLPDRSEIHQIDVTFPGFDSHEEGDQYGFAHYIFEHEQRFLNVKPSHLNSGGALLPRYRKMLKAYEKYQHRTLDTPLSVGEISDVLAAGDRN